jgi:hypothetical protein
MYLARLMGGVGGAGANAPLALSSNVDEFLNEITLSYSTTVLTVLRVHRLRAVMQINVY